MIQKNRQIRKCTSEKGERMKSHLRQGLQYMVDAFVKEIRVSLFSLSALELYNKFSRALKQRV